MKLNGIMCVWSRWSRLLQILYLMCCVQSISSCTNNKRLQRPWNEFLYVASPTPSDQSSGVFDRRAYRLCDTKRAKEKETRVKCYCCFSFALLHSEHSLLLSKLRTVRYALRLAYIFFCYQLCVDLIWFVGRYISCGYSEYVQYLIYVALNSSLNGFNLIKINELSHFL